MKLLSNERVCHIYFYGGMSFTAATLPLSRFAFFFFFLSELNGKLLHVDSFCVVVLDLFAVVIFTICDKHYKLR